METEVKLTKLCRLRRLRRKKSAPERSYTCLKAFARIPTRV